MALITKKFVPPKKQQLNVRLSPDTLEMLASYCKFIESNQGYVLEQLLLQ